MAHSTIHGQLKQAVGSLRASECRLCALLWQQKQSKAYRELGYSSVRQYGALELGLAEKQAGTFALTCSRFAAPTTIRFMTGPSSW